MDKNPHTTDDEFGRGLFALISTGQCHFCGEAVKGGALFCSTECLHDWDEERKVSGIHCRTCWE